MSESNAGDMNLRPRERTNYQEAGEDIVEEIEENVESDLDDDALEAAIAAEEENIAQIQAETDKRREEQREKLRLLRAKRLDLERNATPLADTRSRREHVGVGAVRRSVELEDLRQEPNLLRKADRALKDLNVFSGSDDSDDEDVAPSRRKKKSVKSGKDLKISSNVIKVEKWPHVFLTVAQYSRSGRKYDDLTVEEFVAGYSAILAQPDVSVAEVNARIKHLQKLMYLAMRNTWRSVLLFHSLCLQQIERCLMEWGDDFGELESISLEARSTSKAMSSRQTTASQNTASAIVYCQDYQRGTCAQTESHYGLLFNRRRYLQHVCATCLKSTGNQERHGANSDECPLKSD